MGTAAGDLVVKRFGLGYLTSLLLFGGLIAVVAAARFLFKLNGVLAFWIAYILTRPLGASLGDYLSQPREAGGFALGAVAINSAFLAAILGLVVFLAITRQDATVESIPAS